MTTFSQSLAGMNNHRGMKIVVTGAESLPFAISMQNFGIIMANLTDNAAHHGATSVSIEVSRDGMMARVIIADNGTGIFAGNAPKIFDPFFTARRDAGGTGVGLGIVKAMLGAHGATITFVPSDGGAKFLLTLPLAG